MSYSSDYFNAINKRKKKEEEKKSQSIDKSSNKSSSKSYASEYFEAMQSLESPLDTFMNDIAPVKNQTEQKKQKWYEGWLDTGAFDDGYQFGDLTKTIVSSGADLKSNVAGGALEIGEGLVDSLAYLGGVGAKIAGQDKLAEGAKDFVKKDLYDGKKIASYLVAPEQFALKAIGEDYEDNSIWGDKTDSLAQSAGQLLGTIGLQSVGVPWWVTTGVTSFGGGVEQAFNEGANYAQAGLSAAISAGAEILSEKLFGGSGLGEKGLINIDKLTQGISNKVIKSLVDYGIDVAAEGSEEIVSGVMSNLGTALYKEDNIKDILFSEEAVDEYVQGFIGGAFLGGVMNAGNVKKSVKQKTDYRNGLTANEQKVFDKAYNDAITEAEKSGKKLTGKEKAKIRDNVMENLQKGYISTDTIEGVLGGEAFGEYKSLTEQEKALTDEISQLENLPESQITVKQRERLVKAREELENLADKTELKTRLTDGVRNQISAESKNLTERGSFLDESYKEIERRKQSFEADLTQYSGKQREAVERAVKSGVLNNTNRSHELVNVLSKIEADKGIVFNYADNAKLKETGFAIDGKTVNGFTKDGAVTLNVQSPKAWQSVVGHEVTHILEGTEAYSELQKSLFAYAESKGELASRKSALTELYKNVDADIDAELTADLVGDYLFSDNDFIKHLTSNRTVFEKVYDEIKYLFKVATGKEKADIEKVKRQFDKVWEEFTAEDIAENDNVKFSIREEAPPKETGIAYKVFYVKDGKLYPPMVANPDGADTPIGVWLNADVGVAAPPSKTGRAQVKAGGKGTQGGSGSLAFRPGWHLGDLPRASQFDRVNPETGKKELFPENFVWAEVEYAKDVDYQEEAMSYGYTDNGKFRHAYAGLPRLPENGYYRYRTNPKPDTVPWVITGAMKVNRLLSDAEVNSILEKNGVPPVHRQGGDVGLDKFGFNESGKVNYSVSADSNGNELTEQQREYFKDSKVVDEKGNLDNQNPTDNPDIRYSLSAGAEADIERALNDKNYTEDVFLTESSPSIIASQKGARNLPMLMKASHIRENIFSEQEAKQNGLKVNSNINYHGLGKDLFLKVIDGLDDVKLAYRGTKNASNPSRRENYFLLISQYKDANGNTINVPVFIDEKGQYNRVFIDTNKIATVFGRDNLSLYIQKEIKNGNLVRIKNKSTRASELTSPINASYNKNAFTNNTVPQKAQSVNTSISENAENDTKNIKSLSERVSGDELLNAEDLIDVVKSVGGEVDNNGYITLYHRTTEQAKEKILSSGKMTAKEDGIFFSTKKDGQTNGYGDSVIEMRIPVEKLILDDIFDDEAHLRYPLENRNSHLDVSEYIYDKNDTKNIAPVKNSLSEQGEQPSSVGTPLKDLYYGDDIAPVKETQSTTDTKSTDNIAPITEDEADELYTQWIDSLAEAEAPPETDTEYYYPPDTTSLDDKALENIGKQLREKLSLTPQETKAIQEIVQEYSTSENPNKEELFNKIKEQFGEKVWKERIESIADVKRYLRTNKINVSDEVKKDITDYPQFRKKNANKIYFSKDGLSIDTYYDELVSRFPDYFSYGVDEVYGDLTIPANQLRKIASVANLEIYETKTQDLDDATIQSAVDIISNGITDYKNDLTMRAAEDTAKEALDSIAPAKAEQLTNGTRGEALLNQSLDNHPIATVEDRIAEKQRAIEAEIADNKQLRREAEAGYNAEIERLSQEYLSKKDKNTKVANNIIRRIAKLEKLKASVDADYAKRISDLEARAEKVKSPTYSRAMHKQSKMQENAQWAENLLGDTSTWKDKKIGLQYSTNTERRNLRDIVRDENGNKDIAKADSIDDALNGQYNREEAAKKREITEARKKYADLKITKAEDAYIQMLGELRHNPDTTLTEKVVKEYYEKHKNKIDTAKVDKVIEMARKDYDSWLNRVNKELKNQGMREIPYRQGYFPHFTEPKQNFIQKLLNWKTQDTEIPTSIAGLTETFKPVRTWQSFDKTRYSDTTDYSFMKGFDTYSEGVLDWIYHLDTLQKRRAVENRIRYTHSEDGIQKRIEEVYANEEIDANEAQAQIEQILSEAKNPLNNFVQDFTTHTNILAGKKNSYDRDLEQKFNRHIYSIMTNVQNRVSANMVLANVRSALTNFIPITQSWAQVSPVRSLQAVKDTISNAIVDDGIIDKSTFLTNRLKEPDKLYKTNWDKILDKAGIMFEVVDNFSSQVIWRSKYNQNLADGMTETEAIKNADQFSENVMAGRSKGNEPTLFNAKNPITKAFTMFQLEVNNQYGYFFKDLPNDLKAESEHWKLNLAKGYTTAFIGAYAYNALFSALTGSDAALDPIGIIEDLLRDLGLFDDDEKEEPLKALENFGKNVAEELPFVGGLMGGGRIPIASAIPYSGKYSGGITGAIEDINEGNWGNFINEMSNPLLNVVLPVGGGQIKKAMQGLSMFNTDEEHPIAGSYTTNGNLRFPVDDTLANRVQAGIFGQWANENARDYIENGRKPLTPEQTHEYVDVDLPIADYWKYREGLKGLKKNSEKADYINSLDIKDWQKSLLMNNILDRKEDVDMSNYNNYNSYEEFDYAEKNPEKYEFFKANGISYEDYANADEDGKTAYTWAYNNPEKYKVSKVITDDVVQYRSYTSDLYDIKDDKDENGNAISGTGKSKKIDYINSLDLDYEQKIVLYRMQFKTDDTYNAEIVNYVNSLDYLTYEERVDIFTELGYTVKGGSVYWD